MTTATLPLTDTVNPKRRRAVAQIGSYIGQYDPSSDARCTCECRTKRGVVCPRHDALTYTARLAKHRGEWRA